MNPDQTTVRTKHLLPRAAQSRVPRPRNFEMNEPSLRVRLKEQVTLEAPADSRALYVFLEKEHVDGQDRHAPFGIKTFDIPAGERRTVRAEFGVEGREYDYLVYLVDHDDLADGHSRPRIVIMS